MKTMKIVMLIIAAAAVLFAAQADDDRLIRQSKVLLFDREWTQALELLNELIDKFPNSRHYPLALFYRSQCYEETGRLEQALEGYRTYIAISGNDNLKDEAVVAIIDISYELYLRGERHHAERIVDHLRSRNRTIRYYAAFKLSYADRRSLARKAIPVLEKLIATEDDSELIDRARIALLRIDPEALKKTSASPSRSTPQVLHIQVMDNRTNTSSFSLAIPFSLARLALESIPDAEKRKMREEGIDIDEIFKILRKQDLVRFEDDETILKIWVE